MVGDCRTSARHGRFSRVHQFALVYLFHALDRRVHLPARDDRWRRAHTARVWQRRARSTRAVPRLTSRDPATLLDQRPMDDRATGGSDVGAHATTIAVARTQGGVAALRPQVVHVRDDLADGAHARAARGQRTGRQRAGAVLRRDARRAGRLQRHPRQPTQGQARHAQGADRGADARGRARACPSPVRRDGIRNIAPMLNDHAHLERVCAVALHAARGSRSPRDYAQRRAAFGAPLDRTSRCTPTRSRGCRPSCGARSISRSTLVELLGAERGRRARR